MIWWYKLFVWFSKIFFMFFSFCDEFRYWEVKVFECIVFGSVDCCLDREDMEEVLMVFWMRFFFFLDESLRCC